MKPKTVRAWLVQDAKGRPLVLPIGSVSVWRTRKAARLIAFHSRRIVPSEGTVVVQKVGPFGDEHASQANARLLAASPALLAIAQRAVCHKHAAHVLQDSDPCGGVLCPDARAAIHQATEG